MPTATGEHEDSSLAVDLGLRLLAYPPLGHALLPRLRRVQMTPIEPVYGLVALKIRHVRVTLGMDQETLAKRVGYTRTSIVNIEAGR